MTAGRSSVAPDAGRPLPRAQAHGEAGWPDLAALLGEAFPASWRDTSSAPAECLTAEIARLTRDDRTRVLRQIEGIRSRALCASQLEDLIAFELDCHLRPAEMGLTAVEWLDWVAGCVAGPSIRPGAVPPGCTGSPVT